MKILDMHNASALEVSSTIEADPIQVWNSGQVYSLSESVQYLGVIYKNAKSNNVNNQPDTIVTAWTPIDTVNEKSIYDVYPSTLSVNTTQDIVLVYNVTNVDTIFIGNAKGNTITVSIGGTTESKVLLDSSVSPNQAWGLTDSFHGTGDLFVSLPSLTSGTLTVTLTRNAGEASMGYVLFGEAISVGCTLMSEAVKYNVVSGVSSKGKVTGIERARSDSYIEVTLPIRVSPTVSFSDVLRTLAKYRGVPMLAIGDDTGDREEMSFWGIYSEIDASITEYNGYNIVMTSLDNSVYVPPTKIEVSEDAASDFTPSDFIFWGFDSGNSTEISFNVSSDIPLYYDGLAVATEVNADISTNGTINVNNLGSVPIYKDGALIQAGQLENKKTYLFYYRNSRFNVSTDLNFNYGNNASIVGLNLEYVDEDFNAVSKPLNELIVNSANDATITNQVLTYTDDTDGVTSILIEDLLNQPNYGETDKSSRHYIAGSFNSLLPVSSAILSGIVELATDAETQAGTDTARAVTPASLASLTATTLRSGLIEIATNAEVIAGTSSTLSVTPASLLNYFDNHVATTTQTGTTEIATQAEVDARTDTFRYLTPATFDESEAKTTQKGIIEIATCAETQAGTDTTRAIVPACLSEYVRVSTVTGTPTVGDFGNNDIVFDVSTCKHYRLNGGVVEECVGGGGGGVMFIDNSNSTYANSYTGLLTLSPFVTTVTLFTERRTVVVGGDGEATYFIDTQAALEGGFNTIGNTKLMQNGVVILTIPTGIATYTGTLTVQVGDIIYLESVITGSSLLTLTAI